MAPVSPHRVPCLPVGRRLPARLTAWLLAAALGPLGSAAPAQPAGPRELRVELLQLGASPPTEQLSGADRIVRETPPEAPRTTLAKGELLPLGTRLATGEGVHVSLKSADGIVVKLPPRTAITLASPDRVQVNRGKVGFELLRKLDFAFGVSVFSSIAAIASGTRFTVLAEPLCRQPGQPDDAPCVVVDLEEGRLDIETRPPLRIGEAPAAPSCARGDADTEGGGATLQLREPLAAGQQRVLSLNPERFGVRFATWAEAEAHFRAELSRAEAGGDAQAVLRALRNLGVVLRYGDRDEAALELARQGLAWAERLADRRWQLRFISDAGLAHWRARHDRGALVWLDRALAMTDVLQAAGAADETDLDAAALLARRGIIRFEGRDRNQRDADLDAAEADLRHALALRQAAGTARQALDDQARSHFDLGVLLRIGRRDFAGAEAQLRQALALRSATVGSCQDLLTAYVLTELALAEEELGYAALPAAPARAVPGPRFAEARRHFDDSLALMARLFPEGGNPTAAKAARRAADFHRELAGLWAALPQPDSAAQELALALQRYDQALAVLDTPAPAWQAERAQALGGRGHARLDAGDWPGAEADLRAALQVWQALRCARAPEAPSDRTARNLLDLLQRGATRAGRVDEAAAWQARRAAADPWSACPATGAP